MKKVKILLIIVLIIMIIPAVLLLLSFRNKPSFSYQIDPVERAVIVEAQGGNLIDKDLYICIDNNEKGADSTEWQKYSGNKYLIDGQNNFIHIKDALGNIVDMDPSDYAVLAIDVTYDDPYPMYPVGQQIALNCDVVSIGYSGNLSETSSDENVATVSNNVVTCTGEGKATIRIGSNDVYKEFEIMVTDLYTLPEADSSLKPFLTETICTTEEAHMLDEILEKKINEAGYETRAGVVAAARFLALEFPYKLAYFSESGRLDPASSNRCDGEGRYYHKGLYLSEDKYEDIVASRYGPKYWGLFFREDTSDDHSLDEYYLSGGFVPADIGSYLYLSKRPNGFDCSGHVSWCYYNGGFDLGDLGAGGPGSHGMTQLGELVYVTDELLQSDRIKAGDLVGFTAHIGIVIGVDDEHIWISDANTSGLKNTCYERNVESFAKDGKNTWKYFILMDSEYLEDGNYTPMW